MVVQRGFRQPPSLHIDRLRQAPAGQLFDRITNGFGVMPSYRAQVAVEDRWRIAAYVRVLQASHLGAEIGTAFSETVASGVVIAVAVAVALADLHFALMHVKIRPHDQHIGHVAALHHGRLGDRL